MYTIKREIKTEIRSKVNSVNPAKKSNHAYTSVTYFIVFNLKKFHFRV